MNPQNATHAQRKDTGHSRARRRSRAFAIASLCVLLLAASVWAWWLHRDDVLQLPEPERRALYQHTLDTLDAFCDPTKGLTGLDAYCRQQAELIVQFPECNPACWARADRHRPQPSR
jgi:hypothetical protein